MCKDGTLVLYIHGKGGTAAEADRLLGLRHTKMVNVRCRKGVFKLRMTEAAEQETTTDGNK